MKWKEIEEASTSLDSPVGNALNIFWISLTLVTSTEFRFPSDFCLFVFF